MDVKRSNYVLVWVGAALALAFALLAVVSAPLLATGPHAQAAYAASAAEEDEGASAEAGDLSEDEDYPTDEEVAAVEEASEQFSKAASIAEGFAAKAAKLASIAEELEELQAAIEALEEERADYRSTRTITTTRMTVAQEDKFDVEAQLAALPQTGVLEVLVGNVTLDGLAQQVEELEEELGTYEVIIEEENLKIDDSDEGLAAYDEQIAEQEEALAVAVKKGNKVAAALEAADSASRTYDTTATETVEELDEAKTDAQRIYSQADEINESHDDSRSEARDALASWYCSVDEVSGVESDLTFGTGVDFSLSEEEFVEKWGAAIDAFYESYASEAGFTPPLAGYGEEMATCAYEYQIDPRLCAAVSIAESSGGEYCIRPHNAWGWGADDSDPYALASSWSSWEEAIEAWHEGMASSTTGLADAGSVSALGEIYCSTPTWAATVTEQMNAISDIADEQQDEAGEL